MDSDKVRRIVREELTTQWFTDQMNRAMYGVGQPINESTLNSKLSTYVPRGEMDRILDTAVSNGCYKIFSTHAGLQPMIDQARAEMQQNLRVAATSIQAETQTRLEDSRDRIIDDVLRTDNGNRVITEIERRLTPGASFYGGIALLGFASGLAGALAATRWF